MRLIRPIILVLLAGLGAWLARLLAHSKVPQPEGRWREIGPEELTTTA